MKTIRELEKEIENHELYKTLSDDKKDKAKLAFLIGASDEFRSSLIDYVFEKTYKPKEKNNGK